MDIDFKTNALEKVCNDFAECRKQHGERCARKIIQRLNELRAAENMAVVNHLPPTKLHSIDGIMKDSFAVYVEQPFRIAFVIGNEPIPRKPDGGVDEAKVTFIIITYIGDYHGKRKKK